MAEIALVFLRMNLAAAVAVLVVAALRGPARKNFGASVAYGLWALVPISAAAMLLPARIKALPAPARLIAVEPLPAPMAQAIVAPSPPTHHLDPALILVVLWAIGVLAALALTARNQRRFVTAAGRGEAGPAVIGVIAPRIVTPNTFADSFTAREQRLVLAHEHLHIRRQDSRLNGLVVLVQCLSWFNPLIHVGAHLLRLDQEMACDEAVITRFPGARSLYARALVKAQLATRPLPLGCYWPSGTGHPLVERLTMINRTGLGRGRRLAGLIAVAVLTVTAGAAAWAAQPPAVAPPYADDLTLGSKSAPVVVVEYGSAGCAHCAQQFLDTLPRLKAELIDKGKVRYVYREVLVGNQKLARAGFLTARCGGKGRYFDILHDVFAHESELLAAADKTSGLESIGEAHGLSKGKVDRCLADSKAQAALEARSATNIAAGGIVGAPSFNFVGRTVTISPPAGGLSYGQIVAAIGQAGSGVAPASAKAGLAVRPPLIRAALKTPATAQAADHVCITNACAKAAAPGVRDEAKVQAAIAAKNTGELIRAGGTPAEVAGVLRELCGQSDQPRCNGIALPGTERWGAFADDTIGVFGETGPSTIVGAPLAPLGSIGMSLVRNPDMKGIPAPADVVARQHANNTADRPDAPKPMFKDVVQPDGHTVTVVTGWRQNDGTITSTPNPALPIIPVEQLFSR